MKRNVKFEFVSTIPDSLEDGVVYITTYYNTAVHKCMCGCGNEVVTPLSPLDWELTYNGQEISLYPSIGNWSFKCQSHYWIKRNKVMWAEKWSKKRIAANRIDDFEARGLQYKGDKIKKTFWLRLFSLWQF